MFEDEIDWYCDSCDAYLNRQSGFTTITGSWVCSKCGYENDVTDNNILSEEDAENELSMQQECPKCGGHLARSYGIDEWECEDCGCISKDDGYGNLYYDDESNESLSAYDAALIWVSNGKDEDYMFGYTEEELEDALR